MKSAVHFQQVSDREAEREFSGYLELQSLESCHNDDCSHLTTVLSLVVPVSLLLTSSSGVF